MESYYFHAIGQGGSICLNQYWKNQRKGAELEVEPGDAFVLKKTNGGGLFSKNIN